jgi:hypothetical protein
MIKVTSVLKSWLALAVGITLVCGMLYAVVQQVYRQNADDPQIQMSEDAATALAQGAQPQSLVAANPVDMATSLAPYIIVFDNAGKPIASSVLLDNAIPIPPAGVFDYTRSHKSDWISWQPRPGVRSAAIINYFSGAQSGFVLAGRSLREVENRETRLSTGILIGWIFTLACTLIAAISTEWLYAWAVLKAARK